MTSSTSKTADFQRAITLLQTTAVAKEINPEDVMGAIDRSKNVPREILVRLVDHMWAKDGRVLAYYRQALINGNEAAASDLNHYASHIWANDFVEPLIRLGTDPIGDKTLPVVSNAPPLVRLGMGSTEITKHRQVVELLDKHYSVWAGDATIGPRLHRALEEEPASVGPWNNARSGKATLQFLCADPVRWGMHVQLLAYTHDPALITELRPYLDNSTLVDDGTMESSGRALSTRMCDFAHDAILHILGEPGEFGTFEGNGLVYLKVPDPEATGMGNEGPHNWIWARWDKENAALAKRLDAMQAPTAK
jgi:hypothetical protein